MDIKKEIEGLKRQSKAIALINRVMVEELERLEKEFNEDDIIQ